MRYTSWSSSRQYSANSDIITCWGVPSPAVPLRATSRESGHHAVGELHLLDMVGEARITVRERRFLSSGSFAMRSSNTFFCAVAMTARRQPVAPKYFENEYTQAVL